jgi:hypothetical protein
MSLWNERGLRGHTSAPVDPAHFLKHIDNTWENRRNPRKRVSAHLVNHTGHVDPREPDGPVDGLKLGICGGSRNRLY